MNTEKLNSIVSDYILGTKTEEMAKKYGLTEQGMGRFCHGLFVIGIITREERTARARILRKEASENRNSERNEIIRKMYEEDGYSTKKIADEMSLAISTIYQIITNHGFKQKIVPYPQNLIQAIYPKEIPDNIQNYWNTIKTIISRMTQREQFIISEKYENRKSYAEIAEQLGVTRQRVQAIHAYSIKKIRIFLEVLRESEEI